MGTRDWTRAMGLRAKALPHLFELLYDPLVFLHEPAGVCLFGASWKARRELLAHGLPVDGTLLDLGCGSGYLLASLPPRAGPALGIDPSIKMARQAAQRGVQVVLARSDKLPLPDGSVTSIVASYPGAWVSTQATWDEIARVSAPGAQVRILLGGTVTQGHFSWLRSRIITVLYGRRSGEPDEPKLGHRAIEGTLHTRADRWGTAFIWEGVRLTS